MKERNIALSIVFSIISCGIYGIYWFICLTDEVNSVSKQEGTTGGMAFLFSLLTCGLYSIYWSYKMGEKINEAKRLYGLPTNDNTSILYLILSIFGLDIVVWALLQDDLNKLNACHAEPQM